MSSKLFIPSDILETIVCLNCNNYLSVFPVYTKNDSTGAICGRCKVVDENKFIRDEAYEGIAQFLLFPCKQTANGCKEHLTPTKLEEHEKCCTFRKFDCPSRSYSKCQWKGARTELVEHFTQKHPTLLLKEPFFELNFVTSQEDAMLYPFEDELFVIKKEVDGRKHHFDCSVEHLKTSEESDTYNHFLKIESGNKNYFYKCAEKSTCDNELLNSTRLTYDGLRERLQEPASIIVNIEIFKVKNSSRQAETETATENAPKPEAQKSPDVNWDLMAELECPICYEFMLPPIFQCNNGHSICEVCKNKVNAQCPVCKVVLQDTKNFVLEKMTQHMIYPCRYYKSGCSFACKATEIQNHESCCEFGPYNCPLNDTLNCDWKANHSEVADHIDNNHNEFVLKSDKVDIPFNQREHNEKSFLIKYNKKIFKLYHKFDTRNFYWCVQLVGPPNDAKQYRFEIDVMDLSGSKRRCYHMGLVVPFTEQAACFTTPGKYVFAPLEQVESFISGNISYRARVIKE